MNVYLSEYIHPDALALLRRNANVVTSLDEPEKLDAIILRTVKVDRALIEKAANLKVIAKHGVGYNTIDVAAAKEHQIPVLFTPTTNINSVAELIMGLAITLCRNVVAGDRNCRKGMYARIAPKSVMGLELTGKTLGLVGTGNIAQIVARKMHGAFDMPVLGYDPYISQEKAQALGIEKVDSLEELIRSSDVVNVSVPLTPSTQNMISGKLFDCFKPTAVLINAARGGIVSEQDLYEALKAGKFYGAACDAFVQEPPTGENPLLSLDNFIATPHIGGTTEEALYRTGMEVVEQTLKVLSGGKPDHPVY